MEIDKDEVLTTEEIRQRLKRKSRRTVQEWCRTGHLRASKFGRDWLVNAKDFEEFKNRNMIKVS